MLELGAGPGIFRAIGWLYWGLMLAAVAAALWFPKRRIVKALLAMIALGVFIGPVLVHEYELRQQRDEYLAKRAVAQAQFEMRCQGAGERIERREQGVEGVYLMKVRPERVDYDEQFAEGDIYGHDVGGEDYIKSFLRVSEGHELDGKLAQRHERGYVFVEAVDPQGGVLHRYWGVLRPTVRRDPKWVERERIKDPNFPDFEASFELKRQKIDKLTARYGVMWADISTREDREQWVAGGVLQVIDLQTNTVIAERRGYMWDRGLGSRAGARSPWGFAPNEACPEFSQIGPSDSRRSRRSENRDFVFKTLVPTSGE